jgi:diguanylate cyclase (GGDEF)-like protein
MGDTVANVLALAGRVDRAATHEVSRWLTKEQGFDEGEPQTLADLGALVRHVEPSVLVNAHLMWRGTAIELLEHEAERPDADRGLLERVREVLAERCDAGLVSVSRQFDEPHDRLTGLANRPLLLERLGHALRSASRYGDSVGVVLIEIELPDGAGDAVVTEAAERLQRVARASDTLGRLSRNQFAICAERLRGELEAVAIADRALLALRQPYGVDGDELHLSASAGIAVSSGGDGPETLLASASAARRSAVHG